jgi:uncharacterized protein (TIGR03437 family)
MRLEFLLLVCFPLAAQITILGVTTGAGYLPGITRPGGISVVFCTGLGAVSDITAPGDLPLPMELAGIRVVVNGVLAPLLSLAGRNGYQQINFLVPGLPDLTRTPIAISVTQNGGAATVKLRENPFNGYPADLFRDAQGYGIVRHADGSPVTTSEPAQRGESVIVYATGMGVIEPPGAMAARSSLVLYPGEGDGVKVFFCAASVACQPTEAAYSTALFAGVYPGNPGVYQLEIQIPASAPTGELEMGVLRLYCYDAPCTFQSPFRQVFASQRVKIPIR